MAGVNLNASMNHPSVSRNRTSGTDHWERFDNSKKKKKKSIKSVCRDTFYNHFLYYITASTLHSCICCLVELQLLVGLKLQSRQLLSTVCFP